MTTETDLLFHVPETRPNPLTQARTLLAQAKDDLDRAEAAEDDYGTPVPGHYYKAVREYAALVADLEREAMAGRTSL